MPTPLASFPLAKTCDTDEAQSVLSRELSDLRFQSVRDRSRFHFEMNGVRLGRTMVAYNRFATESEVDAGEIDDAVIVSLSVGPPTVLDLDGELVGPDRLAIVSPQRRLTVHRSPGSGVIVLRAGFDAIKDRYRELTGRELDRPFVFNRSADLDQGVGAHVRQLLAHLVEVAEFKDAITSNPLVRMSLDDMLLGTILALPSNHSHLLDRVGQDHTAPELVRRAEQFIEANALRPLTISDVVTECGCSRGALFGAFRRHRQYTPLQFLQETRLRSARNALMRPSPSDTVTSIALANGFSHLGRFAEAYRRRFGEKPSDTIRNHRG